MSAETSRISQLDRLIESFIERQRQGERPAIEEYVQNHPELAEEIRDVFPTLALMEELGSNPVPTSGAPCSESQAASIPRRLGEYRVLREIGRGGMGVVYEAIQEALGRHVALKVLPVQAGTSRLLLERFRREAQAAARLHHTNIVPIFGVGSDHGVSYYAMQFIPGQTLDVVLQELRNFRGAALPAAEATDGLLSEAAQSLLINRFGPSMSAESSAAGNSMVETSAQPGPSGSTSKPPSSMHSSQSGSLQYFRNVAEVGVQVADALAYAHGQGVVHRDIKPSNLMLDPEGTVWLTDFGLAKTEDSRDLTETGDILGTLRYMAPEQLTGMAEPSSDIYSLGLTLYELATLQPAFDDPVRAKLIDCIRHVDPASPRKVDQRVPRDLETIILKATAKEPGRRYATAADLAADLRRFLTDRPVKARRVGWLEHGWRWCRRQPVLAGLAALVVILLGSVAVISTLSALSLQAKNIQTHTAETAALAAQRAEKHAKEVALDRFWHSCLNQARAGRWSDRSGRRFDGLAALAEAAALRPAPELRNEAIACLALADLAEHHHWDAPLATILADVVDFDPTLEHFSRYDGDDVSVRRTADDAVVSRLPRGKQLPFGVRFSHDGRLLAMRYVAGPPSLRVWDWRAGQVVLEVAEPVSERAYDFSPDDRHLAVGLRDGALRWYDLADGALLHSVSARPDPFAIRYHPAGERIAVTYGAANAFALFSAPEGRELASIADQDGVFGVCWSPDGDVLAVASGWGVHLRSAADPTANPSLLEIAGQPLHDLVFHPEGRLLVGHAWDGLTRLWDTHSGRLLLKLDGHCSRFSPDGRFLSYRGGKRIGLWQVATGAEAMTLYGHERARAEAWCAAFRADGRLLVSGGEDGLRLWDVRSGRERAFVQLARTTGLQFDPGDGSLFSASHQGLHRWSVREVPTEGGSIVHLGPPERLPTPPEKIPNELQVSSDGRFLATDFYPAAEALLVDRQAGAQTLLQDAHLRRVAVSPNGKWIVTARHNEIGFMIWDAATGRKLEELKDVNVGSGPLAFRPDSRELATLGARELIFWEPGDWTRRAGVERPEVLAIGALAYSPDGGTLAYTHDRTEVRLLDVATRKTLAVLDPTPHPEKIMQLVFSPDGGRLLAVCGPDGLRLWDLRAVRRKLEGMNLDWPGKAYRPDPALAAPVVNIEVNAGSLGEGPL